MSVDPARLRALRTALRALLRIWAGSTERPVSELVDWVDQQARSTCTCGISERPRGSAMHGQHYAYCPRATKTACRLCGRLGRPTKWEGQIYVHGCSHGGHSCPQVPIEHANDKDEHGLHIVWCAQCRDEAAAKLAGKPVAIASSSSSSTPKPPLEDELDELDFALRSIDALRKSRKKFGL